MKWTDDRLHLLAQLDRERLSLDEIAERLGATKAAVAKALTRYSYKQPRRPRSRRISLAPVTWANR